MKVKIGENIKLLREKAKMKQEDLGRKLGVGGATISSWEIGRTEPNMGCVQQLADLFNVTTDTLIYGAVGDDPDARMYTSANINFINIPLYAPICCGDGLFVDDQIEGMIAVPSDGLSLPPENYFAQRAKGVSMKDAGIADGDILVFEKTNVPESGMIGCFCIDENEAMCKKYKEAGGLITLLAMNADYDPIIVDPTRAHFSCIGRLKKVIKSFE